MTRVRGPRAAGRARRALLAGLLGGVAGAAGCRAPAPPIAFDGPVERAGIEVRVESVRRAPYDDAVLAVVGSAHNGRDDDLAGIRIVFELVDRAGAKVGDAVAETPGLGRGRAWRFEAPARVVRGAAVERIRVERIELEPLVPAGR